LIEDYFYGDNDRELFKLIPKLKFVSNVYDVRKVKDWIKVLDT